MNRNQKKEISSQLADIRNRVDRLSQKVDLRRFDVLSNQELRLAIALYRKGKGCPSLAYHAVLESTESELISAIHAGYGFDLKLFDEERLSPGELQKLEELQNRVSA